MNTVAPPSALVCERDLLESALNGNRQAFGDLASLHQARSLALATGIVGNREDALDVFQDSVLKAWLALDRFVPGKPFFPWFYRILRNACIQQLRRNKVRQTSSLEPRDDDGKISFEHADLQTPLPHDMLAKDEASSLLANALSRMAQADREILILKHFNGLSYREIADSLSIPVGTVMSRLSTARARLRKLLPNP